MWKWERFRRAGVWCWERVWHTAAQWRALPAVGGFVIGCGALAGGITYANLPATPPADVATGAYGDSAAGEASPENLWSEGGGFAWQSSDDEQSLSVGGTGWQFTTLTDIAEANSPPATTTGTTTLLHPIPEVSSLRLFSLFALGLLLNRLWSPFR
jgi:hypothetical protein